MISPDLPKSDLNDWESISDEGSASDSSVEIALIKLKNNERLKSSVVKTYCDQLPNLSYLDRLLFDAPITVEEVFNQIKEGMHIPLILERHIVVITFNHHEKIVEYYDPKGVALEEEKRRVLGVDLPINEFVAEFTSRFGGRWKYKSNFTKHQYDYTSCGLFVCWYLEARLSRPFDLICRQDGINPLLFRERMIKKLEGVVDQPLPIEVDNKNPTKFQKYIVVMQQYLNGLEDLGVDIEEETNFFSLTGQCLKILQEPVSTNYSSPQEQYQEFVRMLDKACLASTENPELVGQLCYVRWCRVEIYSFLKEITNWTVAPSRGKSELPEFNIQNFSAILSTVNEWVRSKPVTMEMTLQQLSGAIGAKYYTGEENTPNVLARQIYKSWNGKCKTITYSRHGSPTMAGTVSGILGGFLTRPFEYLTGCDYSIRSGEKVAPNYLKFLEYVEEEKVLFVVHQRKLPDLLENERDRVEKIREVQKDHKNFYVLVQSVDGIFFGKKEVLTFESFRKELAEEFFLGSSHSSCALPAALDSEYKDIFYSLFDKVKELFFENKEVLSSEERQTFLLIFYVFQKIDLKFRLDISYYSTPCKDFLDRGGNMALIEMILHLYWMKKENDPKLLEQILYNVIGAAILVKNKEVIPQRLQSGVSALEYIREHFLQYPEKQKAFQDLCFGEERWRVVEIEIPEHEGQKAVPSLAEVRTQLELFSLLHVYKGRERENRSVDFEDFVGKKDLNKEKILKTLSNDMSRGEGVQIFYFGEEQMKTADALFEKFSTEEEALKAMNLFHQGIFAGVQKEIAGFFEIPVSGYDLSTAKKGSGVTCYTYREGKIFAKHKFGLIASDPENKALFREHPYAMIAVEVLIDLKNEKVFWKWSVDEIIH